MKRYSVQELRDFVDRAYTHERVDTAVEYVQKLTYIDDELRDELLDRLADIRQDLYRKDRYEDYREPSPYSAACPWNAPGMSVKDFI